MELPDNMEIQMLRDAGAALELSPAWDVVVRELQIRRQGVITAALLGRLDTYEDYLEKRAEYMALTSMMGMPEQLKDTGSTQ